MKGSKPMKSGSGAIAGSGHLGRERGHDNVGPDGYSRKATSGCCAKPGHSLNGKKKGSR